ncbi:Aldo keto reductase [Seminavis robusta]|uniref:Aldo keto reductase n=1 Tax=Seminavis robusta TaxID=568900 RepID=A0A9N8DP51_9STRA|nr:Aldo keto reductase [Seminavis robusta]|eukprot:Sro271_g104420.1 Aldo keto reductase (631) ;mRNA; r:7921-9813
MGFLRVPQPILQRWVAGRSLWPLGNNHRSNACKDVGRAFYCSTVNPWMGSKQKVGIGGNNWSRMDPLQYQRVIAKGLEHGVTVMEAGQEGGDKALAEAYHAAVAAASQDDNKEPLTVTMRIGYRTIMPNDEENQAAQQEPFPGDVSVEQHPFLGPNRTMTPLDEDHPPPSPAATAAGDSNNNNSTEDGSNQMIQILHNTGQEYIQNQLNTSPLVQEFQKNIDNNNLQVVALLHNPEAQIMQMAQDPDIDINQVSIAQRQEFLKDKLIDAFCAMEQAVANQQISGYGIVSNGLVLPPEHPLALDVNTILQAVQGTMEQMNQHQCHLSVIQLPINLMERTGLDAARELYAKVQQQEEPHYLKDSLEIYAMRPMTCYPDRGTGTGHAFRLVDYLLPTGPQEEDEDDSNDNDKDQEVKTGAEQLEEQDVPKELSVEELASKQWSNQMSGPPLIYSIALRKAMGHFDASHLLEEKMNRELICEERETLDGCRLLQSMLHDLDVGLAEVRSLGAHEEHLYQRIIPLIHDTFEGYDEETADVLEMFFKSYSLAVRYSIARNTRQLLQSGGDDGQGYRYEDIPQDEKLQDYALKYLLKEKAISKVIVGATKPEHVVDLVTLCHRFDDELEKEAGEKEE